MDNPKKPTINHLSLCSGYEGIGLGLRAVLSNVREIAYVEREAFPIANLVAKMEAGQLDAAPVFTDVKTFPYRQFRGCVDILSGGFPCQPFSTAGKRGATEDPRHLFPSIAKGISDCQPRIVFLENVEGILSCTTGDGEPVLKYVLRTLEEMGYRATAGIFSAEEVGAPHRRKRVFILADTSSERGKGESPSQQSQRERLTSLVDHESNGAWPARPGEQQHEWEEPRVGLNSTSEGQAKPSVGRAADGAANRVDRLRLLGNGVVPATAALAFKTLYNELT